MLKKFKGEYSAITDEFFQKYCELRKQYDKEKMSILHKEADLFSELLGALDDAEKPLTAAALHKLVPEMSKHEIVGNLQTLVRAKYSSRFNDFIRIPNVKCHVPSKEERRRKFIMLDPDGSIPENPVIIEHTIKLPASYYIEKR